MWNYQLAAVKIKVSRKNQNVPIKKLLHKIHPWIISDKLYLTEITGNKLSNVQCSLVPFYDMDSVL